MLKSTHKPAPGLPPLPQNWTEHKAPTGHSYYYNSVTKQSTYTRPAAVPPPPATTTGPTPAPVPAQDLVANLSTPADGLLSAGITKQGQQEYRNQQYGVSGLHNKDDWKPRRQQPPDRPKKKQAIPGCEPWVLVYTELKRRFVYNPERNESFWKFPPEVMKAVIDMDLKNLARKDRKERGEPSDSEDEERDKIREEPAESDMKDAEFDSDEYEEVEVTDDDEDEGGPSKRPKFEDEKPAGPIEFNEEDIAYQLAEMGRGQEDYDDYGEDWQEGYEETELGEEDAKALFMDLLEDFNVNPYTPWETIVEEGKIVDDDRYTCLPNMKSRKDTWDTWSRDKIKKLKEQRDKQEKRDPRIPYMSFLEKNATPKLYWPEFRRKYNKESVMRDSKLKDKDREKWYRDYINRLKLTDGTLKEDLMVLLKSVPLSHLNRSTSLSALPPAILIDIRYISLRAKVRDPLVEGYIALLPPAPETSGVSPEDEAEVAKAKQERQRREKALADRERRVREDKRKHRGRLEYSKGLLREEEEGLRRATGLIGKSGLMGHLDENEKKDIVMND